MSADAASRPLTGVCFDIQRYSIHDGPGIRTTVFLKGCPLACGWCHNPEGMGPEQQILLRQERCIGCGACIQTCPVPEETGASTLYRRPDPERCLRCGSCVAACPSDARRLVARTLTVGELVSEVSRDRPFYEESSGGVTFSGGEPLMQPEFLQASLRACQDIGLHTAVDTSGHAEPEVVLETARHADLFLFDLKLLDDERHRRATGVGIATILENLRALDRSGAAVWVRVPLIPTFNDDAASIEAIGALVASLERTRRVHVLPYHRLGTEKLGGGSPYQAPSAEVMARARECLASFGLEVHEGG